MSKADRRARKRERKARGEDGAFWEEMEAYVRTRIVCDRCGLEQPFATAPPPHDDSGIVLLAPCAGPMGLPCDSETATWLSEWTS